MAASQENPDQLWERAAQILNSDEAETRAREALDLCERGLALVGAEGPRSLRARLLQTAAAAASYAGKVGQAVKYGYQALEILDADGPAVFATLARDLLSRDLRKLGRYEEADKLVGEAHNILDSMERQLAQTKAQLQAGKRRKWWQFWR